MSYLDRLPNSANPPIGSLPKLPIAPKMTIGSEKPIGSEGYGGNSQTAEKPIGSENSFGSRGSSENYQGASPIWIIQFANGTRRKAEFDPPITQTALLEKWNAGHPGQPVTATLPIPPELWAAMEIAAGRFDWCADTWPMQIELILDALISGRATAAQLTSSYSTPPPGYEPQSVDTRKPEILNAMGIDRYESKSAPAFTLASQSAPIAPDTAASLLSRFNYRVQYLRDPEAAQRALSELLNRNPALLGIDIETMSDSAWRLDSRAGLDPYKASIRLLQLADRETVLVFDLLHIPAALIAPAMDRPLIAHNAGFEYRFLTRAGLSPKLLHCSLLMARVATGKTQGLGLADCSKAVLNVTVDKTLQVSSWHNPELSTSQIEYAALDAVLALKLSDSYLPIIRSTGQTDAYKRLVRALPVVAHQMLAGVPFDSAAHKQLMDDWRREIEPLRESLTTELGINPDSAAQLAQWLSKTLDNKTLSSWPKTASGQLSTDADTLLSANHPALVGLRRYKILGKQLSTYGDGYTGHIHPVTGRVHSDFGIGGTKGGRFYCRNPNLQNAPRDPVFRALFKAPPGRCLVVADYSQVELRIAALLAPDKVMLAAYQQGSDLHIRTAAAVSGIPENEVTKAQRQLAKACNFGLIYGMGSRGLAAYASASYGVDMPLKAAEQARSAFFTAYPGIHAWHSRTRLQSAQNQTVRTRGGLVRDLGNEQFGWKLTEALNTPVQGSGAECLLESLIALPGELAGLDAKVIHHVHDEIILECAESDAGKAKVALTSAMQKGFDALFPEAGMPGLVEAHSGPDWHSAKG